MSMVGDLPDFGDIAAPVALSMFLGPAGVAAWAAAQEGRRDGSGEPMKYDPVDLSKYADYRRATERGKRAEEARAAAQQQLAEVRKAPRTSNYTPIQVTMPSFTLGAEED